MTKAVEFREKAKGDEGRKSLLSELETKKKELSDLRTAQVTNGASSKLNKNQGSSQGYCSNLDCFEPGSQKGRSRQVRRKIQRQTAKGFTREEDTGDPKKTLG